MESIPLPWIIFGAIALLSWLVSANLKRKFKAYSQTPLRMNGREVALKMLHDNNIYDVQVTSTSGFLTDHYNPTTKTVTLSESVYREYNVASAAVAAHECGHAIQHAMAYAPLQLRSAFVPVVQFSSYIVQWILLGGMMLIQISPYFLLPGIILFALTTLFAFITLPVEINASQRAIAWLSNAGVTASGTDAMAKSALRSAAYTYIVAALGSLATLIYYIMIFLGRRR